MKGEFGVEPVVSRRGIKIITALSVFARSGKKIIIVVRVNQNRRADLFQIGNTFQRERFAFGCGQRRQKQRSQNGDDGDDDQKFDQSEGNLERTILPWHHCHKTILVARNDEMLGEPFSK
jgi:hypothetical protein